jgi:hypothetical protein
MNERQILCLIVGACVVLLELELTRETKKRRVAEIESAIYRAILAAPKPKKWWMI